LELLTQMLEQSADLEAVALAELTRQQAPLTIPPELFPRLRERLQSERAITCQAACTALAALGDFGSVEPMEELLSSSSAGVRTTAHRALCVLSGLSLPNQPSAWHAWRLHESRWFDEREQALVDAIVDGETSEASAALSEIAAHRWERHRLSSIASEGLRREEASIREEAASVLAQLDSPRARKVLQAAATRGAARPESKR
jgi:HEAT repeat protein